jgi:myo-inositol 2-dehydrogenase / D-chiro-inositol 1-dehydrogenase
MRRHCGSRLTRRAALGRLAAAAGGLAVAPAIVPAAVLGAQGAVAPSEKITVGFLGVGGHGISRNLGMFLGQSDAEPVAVCDVDSRRIDEAMNMLRQRRGERFTCQTTKDWREVVGRDDVDAVMISTQDQWHVPMSLGAIRAGMDVICEKPTLTVAEGRAQADAVERYGAVFQFATEGRSLAVYHRMAELVRNGRIGKVQRVLVRLPAGPGHPGDPTPKPVPEGLDWNLWLGPAPEAPYRDGLHMFHWRWNRDYSGGQLTDWGAHLIDITQWAIDRERTGPVEVEGTGKRHEKGLYDTFFDYHLTYQYADGVELQVDSGGVALRFEGADGWVGNDGWIGAVQASSEEILHSPIGPDEIRLFTEPRGEHRNFLDCVKSRREPYFPAEVGHRCCTISHIGNIALELGRKLRWDPKTERFGDDEQANRMLARAARTV